MATETKTNHAESTAPEFDAEISFRGTVATGIGILVVTILSMFAMWSFSEYLRDGIRAKDLPQTAVEQAAQRQIEEANRQLALVERRRRPALEWPWYARQPAQPQVQVQPWTDMREFLEDEQRVLDDYGWVNREAGLAQVPVSRAMDQIATDGVPLMLAPLPESAQPSEQVPSITPGTATGPEGR